jgi:hypothetical protein
LNKIIISKKVLFREFIGKRFIAINSIFSLAVAGILISTIIVYGQTQARETIAALQQNVPWAQLIYNNHKYDMSPFIFVNNGNLNKIQFPTLAYNNAKLRLQEGSKISFQFNKQPIGLDAFVVDYDGDIPSLHALSRAGPNTFEVKGPQGFYNLEIHALFPDGQYTSHTILADFVGRTFNDGLASQLQESCDAPIKLQVTGVETSNQKDMTGATTVLDNNLGTVWSADKAIDIMSSARKHELVDNFVNKNSWIQLDLGKERSLCSIGIAYDNGDRSVSFFTVQTSMDGIQFRKLGNAQSTPINAGGSLYSFPDLPYTARYIRITNLGDIMGAPPSIAEVIAVGK